ncbi:uncharacterized protein LOC100206657 [Hydra vulgaris]|uniref:uncharacterized protein LOC100206657 n=1 Tax=Hydra vulgaris TaxID=6087 RepID=UPI0032EA6556
MSWCRAVWLEGSTEEELTIPSVWIEGAVNEKQFVRWPNGINVLKACKQQAIPHNDWFSFPLLKEKCRHNDKTVCEGFDFTSDDSEAYSNKQIDKSCDLTFENEKGIKYRTIHKIPVCPEEPMFVRARSRSPYDVSSHCSALPNPGCPPLAITEPRSKQAVSKSFGFKTSKSSAIISSGSKTSSIFSASAVKSCQSQFVSSVVKSTDNTYSKIPVSKFLQMTSSSVNLPSSSKQVTMPPVKATQFTKTSISKFPLPEAKFQYKVIHLLTQILEEQARYRHRNLNILHIMCRSSII